MVLLLGVHGVCIPDDAEEKILTLKSHRWELKVPRDTDQHHRPGLGNRTNILGVAKDRKITTGPDTVNSQRRGRMVRSLGKKMLIVDGCYSRPSVRTTATIVGL